jgi:simple sugar transport system substrate-binding protein
MMDGHRKLAVSLTVIVLLATIMAGCQASVAPAPEGGVAAPAAPATEPKYHFVMVSHIGAGDPNMLWLTYAIEDFQKRFPEVTIDYVSTDQFSVENLVSLTRQTVATKPDGLAIPIVAGEALAPVLQEAIDQGIPVVAVNTIPGGEKTIPYLAYIGGDLYQDGVVLGRALLDAAAAGKVPQPTGAVCANPDIGHQGLVTRCNGFNDTMAAAGISSEMLDISTDPARESSIMQAYLQGHPEVNAIFSTTARTGPVIYAAAKELNLAPDADGEGVTIVSVDESPVSLEGVKAGHILATHSQGFYLQGFTPFEILFYNRELGYRPTSDVLSGPILIDSSNVDKWIPLTRNAFGDQYDTLAQGAWD